MRLRRGSSLIRIVERSPAWLLANHLLDDSTRYRGEFERRAFLFVLA